MTVRRLLVVATLAVGIAVPLLPAGAGARSPAYVQVVEKEYTLQLSRLRIPAGKSIVQAINFGMDNHDLVLKSNRKGSKPIVFKLLTPSGRASKTIKLPPGRYTLWCSVSDHRARGMVATLKVG